MQVDSLSKLGVCVDGGAEPVEPAVEEELVPGLEVDELAAGVEVELEAAALAPSPALQGSFVRGNSEHAQADSSAQG